MQIQIGYDIEIGVTAPTALIYMLQVHPSRAADIQGSENITISPPLVTDHYRDSFDNQCARVHVPLDVSSVRLRNQATVYDTGLPDTIDLGAREHAAADLPVAALPFVLPSRYCEVDSELLQFAWANFLNVTPGWSRVQAICDFVHGHLRFDYQNARATRTALEGFREGTGVCRDFAHLAITLCRCMNIPARYCNGLPGRHRHSATIPIRWISRVVRGLSRRSLVHVRCAPQQAAHRARGDGAGRDAADVPITMVFGANTLQRFEVTTREVLQ
jgi:transglutaminase-like putative cysteine protease